MSLTQPEFLNFIRNCFKENNSDFDKILNKLNPEMKNKLQIYSHFYYFICRPDKQEKREELSLIGVTSLIEAMMAEIEYRGIFEYFESEFPDTNKIKDVKKFKEDYFSKYGTNKKIISYFEKYISKDDAAEVIKGIKVYSAQTDNFKSLKDLNELAKLLYQMRNDFVHRAEMRNFCPKNVDFALLKVGKEYYDVFINIDSILRIFERSFVEYWKEKAGL